MKKWVAATVGLAVRIGLGAVEVGGLPAWELADTEVSTNVPFAFGKVNARHFLLSLELAGTPSNNVQVAFGRDINTNGVLDVGETGATLGWDCGRWRARVGIGDLESGIRDWTLAEATTNGLKALAVDVTVLRGEGRQVASTENGEPLVWTAEPELAQALYDRSWDMLRLTVRGVDRADESLRAALRLDGLRVIVR